MSQRIIRASVVFVACLLAPVFASADEIRVDLQGRWACALDRNDEGVEDEWFARLLPDRIHLPGSLQEHAFGDPPGVDSPWTGNVREDQWEQAKYAPYRAPDNFKMPFWLQPKRVYVGPAWYQRDVTVEPSWAGSRVLLHLERCHWSTRIWVDDQEIGTQDSLSTPHRHDLTEAMTPGRHRLTIRVDNRLHVAVGVNSHSVSDHTQTNWNGIVGQIQLRTTPRVFIDDVQVYPDIQRKAAQVVMAVGGVASAQSVDDSLEARITCRATSADHVPAVVQHKCSLPAGGGKIEFELPLGDEAKLWDEFNPNLYTLTVELETAEGVDQRTVTFGLREVTAEGRQFLINGRPVMFRGTLECCIFPLTGYPPTDVDSWRRVIRICQAHGLNHIRFHSHCPPEAAFRAADELGFYLQVECASWANQGSGLGLGAPIDQWIYAEAERIRREYGNHPSFVLMAYGNEPAGPERGGKYLGPWVEHQKQADSRRLYTSAAGWPMIEANQYHNPPAPRIQAWGAGLNSRINARPPETLTDYQEFVDRQDVPVISHEIGQWCVYPNFDEMPKYTGVLQPKNFEIFRDFLNAASMGDQAHDFLMASGKLQTLCYKEEIESALRTPSFGGFQLLDLHDFPGQGTALVGVLDPFWNSKPYVSPAEFRRFCGPTVPLARMVKRTWTSDETFAADVEVTHFGAAPLVGVTPQWTVTCGTDQVAAGSLPTQDVPIDHAIRLGRIELPLSQFDEAAELKLTVSLEETESANDWDFWVYPAQVDTATPDEVLEVDELNDAAVAHLQHGGRVFLSADPRSVRTDVEIGFSSIFWNTAWTGGQAPQTLGILCDPEHPALATFPTEYHTNWQWWELVSRSGAMILDDLPTGLRPIVQVVPDWFTPERLGLVFEAKVHAGKLLVCSIDLENDLASRPVARQMRHTLLRYMASEAFDPQHEVAPEQLRDLFRELPTLQKLGAKVWADSQQQGYEADRAIDGDPATMWHTAWEPQLSAPPHWLAIDLGKSVTLAGLTCLPRSGQDNGRIGTYELYVSDDPNRWGQAVASGQWKNDAKLKSIRFDPPIAGRYIKLVALREVEDRSWSSLADIDILIAE